ncbi:MAG: RodZ domain-containing protein [Bacillota bacterium]
MKDIGEALKRAREERGLSLREVQTATKIRQKYLEALEAGDDSVMPGEVYTKGFIRSYAEYLGLDGWEMVGHYKAWKDSVRPSSELKPEERPVQLRRVRPPHYPAWVLVLLLVAFGGFLGRQYYLSSRPVKAPPVEAPVEEEPAGEPEPTPEEPPGEPGMPAIRRVEISPTVVEYHVPAESVQLEVGVAPITDRCWMHVTVDGRVVFDGMLAPGQIQAWETSGEVRIRAGRPWSLTFNLNGVSWGPEGDREGVPMDLLFKVE